MALAAGTRLGPSRTRFAPQSRGRDQVLLDHLSKNPELRERFEREARAISQLSHPHIYVLYDIGQREGSDYLVLEYLEGETLGARLRTGGTWQVSTGGGLIPYWPKGDELFYTTADMRVIGVQFEAQGANFVVGKSRELFQGRAFGGTTGITVSRDGKRWLVTLPVEQMNASPLILETNWVAGPKN